TCKRADSRESCPRGMAAIAGPCLRSLRQERANALRGRGGDCDRGRKPAARQRMLLSWRSTCGQPERRRAVLDRPVASFARHTAPQKSTLAEDSGELSLRLASVAERLIRVARTKSDGYGRAMLRYYLRLGLSSFARTPG